MQYQVNNIKAFTAKGTALKTALETVLNQEGKDFEMFLIEDKKQGVSFNVSFYKCVSSYEDGPDMGIGFDVACAICEGFGLKLKADDYDDSRYISTFRTVTYSCFEDKADELCNVHENGLMLNFERYYDHEIGEYEDGMFEDDDRDMWF